MATFPYTPSFSHLGHPHVPAQEDVALSSGPEPQGVGGGHVHSSPDGHLSPPHTHTPSFSYLGHPHVPAQEDVALDSGPALLHASL